LPIKETTVAVDNGENGIAVATVIEKCQCVSECYRKSYYEKYRETDSRKEVVRIIYSTLTPQIKGNHRVISYYHRRSVFRADSSGLCLGLIALTTQVSNIY